MRKLILVLLVLSLATLFEPLQAKQFVTLNGRFRIDYPENWKQLDYRYVDSVLFGGNSYPYEGVFAPDLSSPLDQQDYLVLTVDTSGKYEQRTVDSVLNGWKTAIGGELKRYGPEEEFSTLWRPVEVSYWPKSSLASVYTDPKGLEGDHTRSQLIVKFYGRGSANFYFYGPDSTWTAFQPIIKSIVGSFSTENIEAALTHSQVKVVDVDQVKSRSVDSSGGSTFSPVVITTGAAAAVIIIATAVILARRKKKSATSNS